MSSPLSPAAASAASSPGTGVARLEMAVSDEYQGGNAAGNSCNFFSAGTGPEFASESEDVRIVKRGPTGALTPVNATNVCVPVAGRSINQRALFERGSGSIDPRTGAGQLQWTGAFTANAYGGMVPWWIADPKLTVSGDGSGTLTATVGGRGASLEHPDDGFALTPRSVTIATFTAVELDGTTLTIQPEYDGVDYFPLESAGHPESGRQQESAIPADVKARGAWGSWPSPLVDFHYESGLSSYWHSSGGPSDPHKPPLPLRIDLDGGEQITAAPQITQHPSTSASSPFIEGRDVTFTAGASGADTVEWEQAASADGPWTAIDGATAETLTIPEISSSAWNGRLLRLTARNSAGTASSGSIRIETAPFEALRFERQPTASVAIEGTSPELAFTAAGRPGATVFAVEVTSDGGLSWSAVDGTAHRVSPVGARDRITLPPAELSEHSRLLRVAMTNTDRVTLRSDPVSFTVIAATGERQIVVAPLEELNPAAATTLTVLGAGFDVPEATSSGSYSLDVALFDARDWQPGQPGSRDWVATSDDTVWGQLYPATLRQSGGSFAVQIDVPAGTLDDRSSYGVTTFLRHQTMWWTESFDNRAADTFTPVDLTAPLDSPTPLDAGQLTASNRGDLSATSNDGRSVTISTGSIPTRGYVAVTIGSEPGFIGWFRVPANGELTVPMQARLIDGAHRVAVQGLDESVLGWADIEVHDAVTPPVDRPTTPPTDPRPGTGSAGTGAGTSDPDATTRPGESLASAGFEGARWVTGAAIVTILGALILLSSRRRQQGRTR